MISEDKAFTIKTNYEVLIGHNYDWVERHGGDAVPDRAFIGGHTSKGYPIYVGRCDMHLGKADEEVVGKIDRKFYYASGDGVHSDCVNHQIMVC